MNPDKYFKKILIDADLHDAEHRDAQIVLNQLWRKPEVFSPVEPPAGYESMLINSLRAKLADDSHRKFDWTLGLRSLQRALMRPQLSWGFSFGLVFLLVFSFKSFQDRMRNVQEHDLLSSTAKKADVEDLNRWLASVGDSAVRMRYDDASIASLASHLTETRDAKSVNEALAKVAQNMGMKL